MEEICDLEGDDRELFSDQLCSIGEFARISAAHAFPLLTALLENRVCKLEERLTALQTAANSVSNIVSSSGSPIPPIQGMENLFEDLHWLLLIAGHMIADESTGETPLIPSAVVQYSAACVERTDVTATLDFMFGSQSGALVLPNYFVACSTTCVEGADLRRSPQTTPTHTVLMFHKRYRRNGSSFLFIRSYLFPDERDSVELSASLSSIFGKDSTGGKWMIGFLLDTVRANLTYWASEPALAEDTVLLLLSLVDTKSRAEVAVSFECLWQLGQLQASREGPISQLPAEVHRFYVQALVLAGSSEGDHPLRDRYWKQFLQSMHNRFGIVCHQPNFVKLAQKEPIKAEVQSLLESFKGVALAVNAWNVNELFDFLLPVLRDSVTLLSVYHTCPEVAVLVLEFYVNAVEAFVNFLSQTQANHLFKACLSLLDTYTKCNMGKHSLSSLVEEEQFYDLLLLMKLLSHMLTQDILNLGPDVIAFLCAVLISDGTEKISAGDVTLYGLNIILPLITVELLKFPSLCEEYFKLSTFVCEVYPEKVVALPDGLFHNMMSTLEVGLSNYDSDISKMSLESVASLIEHFFKEMRENPPQRMLEIVRHFLRLIFNMVLLESFDMDLLQPASCAFHALICSNQGYYTELVRSLLAHQGDPVISQRLLGAFHQLTPSDMKLSLDKHSKAQFRRNLDTFLANVKGFLCRK
ncbi:predicted protein [Nematostella vectensis]|uniref:Exportin-4 n=1 Tax=Nematostella vectensis TaxID=45351 RepID=A7SV48_NEMVE|nr:predicted protein [Nematostella vectensis]|eukprot:XP_001624528.1 predicted protein [Nematostella vectensis]